MTSQRNDKWKQGEGSVKVMPMGRSGATTGHRSEGAKADNCQTKCFDSCESRFTVHTVTLESGAAVKLPFTHLPLKPRNLEASFTLPDTLPYSQCPVTQESCLVGDVSPVSFFGCKNCHANSD